MKINDVEKITGLTQKAIRLYESKGLISVIRDANGYRNYSDENVQDLKNIKLFRSIGASISDIKLYLFGVITIDELVDKCRREILKENGKNSEKYQLCESVARHHAPVELKSKESFTENEEIIKDARGRLAVGIDVGTTTVSAVVYDLDSCESLEAYSIPHNSRISSYPFSEQRVSLILEKAEKLLFHILDTYKRIVCIGITGQMHGIVYVDNKGQAVSELINWQDGRGDLSLGGGSACQQIEMLTGEKIHTGYGIATHYYNVKTDSVPKNAACFCSIMDLLAMKICGVEKPTTHKTIGASFGLFDTKNGDFMWEKLEILGIDKSFLPKICDDNYILGECRGIPVSLAIGDNQASFLGAVGVSDDALLVNIGTGSQVCAACDYQEVGGDVEIRPFIGDKYLICGSALCGGSAYAMVEEFFRGYLESIGIDAPLQYDTLNRLASEAHRRGEKGLDVDTRFLGKRGDSLARGAIREIDIHSFTPSALALGVLKGMCKELCQLYSTFDQKKARIVSSGGAVRKNALMQTLIEEMFGLPVTVSLALEEAALGAAIFSALAIKGDKQR